MVVMEGQETVEVEGLVLWMVHWVREENQVVIQLALLKLIRLPLMRQMS